MQPFSTSIKVTLTHRIHNTLRHAAVTCYDLFYLRGHADLVWNAMAVGDAVWRWRQNNDRCDNKEEEHGLNKIIPCQMTASSFHHCHCAPSRLSISPATSDRTSISLTSNHSPSNDTQSAQVYLDAVIAV